MNDGKNINYDLLERAIENSPISACELCGEEMSSLLLKPMSDDDKRMACIGCGLTAAEFKALLKLWNIPFTETGEG